MTEREEVIAARRWIERAMSTDPDVRELFTNALTNRGYGSLSEFARDNSVEFMQLYDWAKDMVDQMPLDQLQSADGHRLVDG